METGIGNMSGSALRKLALKELKEFILLLDAGAAEELQRKRTRLMEIFAELAGKEQREFESLIREIAGVRLQHDCSELSQVSRSVSSPFAATVAAT